MKRILCIFFALFAAVLFVVSAAAAGTGIEELAVNPYGNDRSDGDTVVWQEINGSWYLFLPSDTVPTTAKVYFTASSSVQVDGASLTSGASAGKLAQAGSYTLRCGTQSYPLTVVQSANIPAVYINLESHTLSWLQETKEHKDKASIRIYEDGALTLDGALKQIKGRGNTTWALPKKPYNIKFDKKTDLFGMGKAKKWSLLASYGENSLLRNPTAFTLADMLGLHYTSHFRHVDLYINNEYQGNYILCESVEVGDNRVEINDLDAANEDANPDVDLESLPTVGTGKNGAVLPGTSYGSMKWVDIPQEPEDVSGGYLMELEYYYRYDEELSGFVTSTGQPVVMKSPELATEGEVRYAYALVDAAFRALKSPDGYNAEGRHYTEYFDMDTFVNMYILEEYSKDFDAGYSSFYLYKSETDGKLYFSPAWDYDSAFGLQVQRRGENVADPARWFANEQITNGTPTVLSLAYRQADFRQAVIERYQELVDADMFGQLRQQMETLSQTTRASAVMNAMLWNTFKSRSVAACETGTDNEVAVLLNFLDARDQNLRIGFSDDAAWLTYELNGANALGTQTCTPILTHGEQITLIDLYDRGPITPPTDNYYLQGWNTKADGSGTQYLPGAKISLTEPCTILYAIWGSKPVTAKDRAYTPGKVSGLNVKATGDGALTLTWNAVAGATQYNIYRYNGTVNKYLYVGTTFDVCQYTVNGLVGGTSYWFKVQAVSKAHGQTLVGTFSNATSALAVSTPLAATQLQAELTSANTVTLTWNEVYSATQYNIYHIAADGSYNYIGTSYTTSYEVRNLAAAAKATFRVMSVAKGAGLTFKGPFSRAVQIFVLGIPAALQNVSAAASGDSAITIRWDASAGATRYNVYRWNGTKKAYVRLATTQETSYTFTELTPGLTWYFRVQPESADENYVFSGALSKVVSAVAVRTPYTPENFNAAPCGANLIRLSWDLSDYATQYNIYQYRAAQKIYAYIGTSYTDSFEVRNLTNGENCSFYVVPVYKQNGLTLIGEATGRVSAVAVGKPAALTNLKATGGSGSVTLTWAGGEGATKYQVYRYRGDLGTYVKIGETKNKTYKVSGLYAGTTYYFRVVPLTSGSGMTFTGPQSQAVNAKA